MIYWREREDDRFQFSGRRDDRPRNTNAPKRLRYQPRPPQQAQDLKDRVKRCLNCEHFSSDHQACSNCGLPLRKHARLFMNPTLVHSNLKHWFEKVENVGPDFKPFNEHSGYSAANPEEITPRSAYHETFSDEESEESQDHTLEKSEPDEDEIITIVSDDDDDDEPPVSISDWNNNLYYLDKTHKTGIAEESSTDLIHQMLTDQSTRADSFVKCCPRCNTYSFDLQQCETCDKEFSSDLEIVLYCSLTKRKLKLDKWRKTRYQLAQSQKDGISLAPPTSIKDKKYYNIVLKKIRNAELLMNNKIKLKSTRKQKDNGGGVSKKNRKNNFDHLEKVNLKSLKQKKGFQSSSSPRKEKFSVKTLPSRSKRYYQYEHEVTNKSNRKISQTRKVKKNEVKRDRRRKSRKELHKDNY